MIGQLFADELRAMIKRKNIYLWNLIFPLVIAIFLYGILHNLNFYDQTELISVAVVTEIGAKEDYSVLVRAMQQERTTEGDKVFQVTVCSKDKAINMLESGKICAYIWNGDGIQLYIAENGIEQSRVKAFIDQYVQSNEATAYLLEKNPEAQIEIPEEEEVDAEYMFGEDTTKKDTYLVYYMVILGFSCMLALRGGLKVSERLEADQSPLAARLMSAPIPKEIRVISIISANGVICTANVLIVYYFMKYLLKVEFEIQDLYVLILALVGVCQAILLGILLGVFLKGGSTLKESVCMGIVLICSFLAGSLRSDVKYYVSQKVWFLSKINPVALITDGLYALHYYTNVRRYVFDLVFLLFEIIILAASTFLILRRRQYGHL